MPTDTTSTCANCNKQPALPGRRWCAGCAAYGRNAHRKFRSRPKEPGVCRRADCTNMAATGRVSCDTCRRREREYESTIKDKKAFAQRQLRRKLRVEVFEAYGGAVCCCCGEEGYEFLTIDHVEGNGADHRRVIGNKEIYHWLKKNNYPEGFRVLCMNCNFALGYHGYCPHRGWVQPTSNGRLGRKARTTAEGD